MSGFMSNGSISLGRTHSPSPFGTVCIQNIRLANFKNMIYYRMVLAFNLSCCNNNSSSGSGGGSSNTTWAVILPFIRERFYFHNTHTHVLASHTHKFIAGSLHKLSEKLLCKWIAMAFRVIFVGPSAQQRLEYGIYTQTPAPASKTLSPELTAVVA